MQAVKRTDSGLDNVAVSGAADREPVDSAVRVTVPMQRPIQSDMEAISSNSKATRRKTLARPADIETNDTLDEHRPKKRRKNSKQSGSSEMVIIYESSSSLPETELYQRLYNAKTSTTCARHFKNARRILAELGPCAADLVCSNL